MVENIFDRDLRTHVAELEKRDLLIRVKRPINKDTELHPLVRLQFRGLPENQRRAFLFENVVDSKGTKYDIPVLVGGLAGSDEIYAVGLQCAQEEIAGRWRRAVSNTLEPKLVQTGKIKEVIHKGTGLLDHRGLAEFPIPISTPGFDTAPYITAASWITKDPESGQRNAGMYRAQIKEALKTGLYLTTGNNTAVNWEKANAKGKALEAAAVIGGPVAVAYAAIQTVPYGIDELAVAGGLVGAAIPVVKAETVDLEVPADAEIVLEGHIRTDLLEPEGSFGESHGYSDPRTLSPVFQITAITHRRNPIWMSVISQLTPSESSKMKQDSQEAFCVTLLRDHHGFKGVRQVRLCEPLLNRQYAVIKLKKSTDIEPWDAMYALLGTRARVKMIVAVDEDIDADDPLTVNWAIVNRCQPHRDIRIVHPRPLPHGPLQFLADGQHYDTFDSALLIDATMKCDFPPISLPSRDHMEMALGIWKELELPPLDLRSPWYGYSLGRWTSESAEEAKLATDGDSYTTGKKLAGKGIEITAGNKLAEIRRRHREPKNQ